VQTRPTLSDKIFTEEEEYRMGYSENPDFFAVENKRYRTDSNFGTIYFALGSSYAPIRPTQRYRFSRVPQAA
jgi:hypothetical protein